MKALGILTPVGKSRGLFVYTRMERYGRRVRTPVGPPLILKDEVRARPARHRLSSTRGMSGEPAHPQVKTR